MHVMGIRQEIVDRHPWVPVNLFHAFEKSKAIGMRRMENPRIVPLAWYLEAWNEQQEILGPDPWEYGLGDKNRHNMNTIAGYSHEQGLTKRRWTDRRPVHQHVPGPQARRRVADLTARPVNRKVMRKDDHDDGPRISRQEGDGRTDGQDAA